MATKYSDIYSKMNLQDLQSLVDTKRKARKEFEETGVWSPEHRETASSIRSKYGIMDDDIDYAGLSGILQTRAIEEQPQTGYSQDVLDSLASLQTQVNKPWSYDVTQDPLYEPLKQQYEQAGQTAFNNVIGRLSALTGGRPSTAAVGTATGAQKGYAQEFAGTVLPSLTEQAYGRHRDTLSDQLSLLNTRMGIEDTEFNRQMQIDAINWDRNENNPAVKAQMLSNSIAELELANLPEQLKTELEMAKAQLSQAQTIADYAPREAEARLNQIYASIAATKQNIAANQQGMEESQQRMAWEAEDREKRDETPAGYTQEQVTAYNNLLNQYLNPTNRTIEESLAYARSPQGKLNAMNYGLNEGLYNQMIAEIESKVQEGQTEPTSYKALSLDEITMRAEGIEDIEERADFIIKEVKNAGYSDAVTKNILRGNGLELVEEEEQLIVKEIR